jgi:hypothetical protein
MNKFLIMSIIVTSIAGLIFSSNVSAKPSVTKGPLECNITQMENMMCCQTETGKGGIEIRTCTICDNTVPPSNCTPRFQVEPGLSNPTGPKGGIDVGQSPLTPPKSNDGDSSKGSVDSGQSPLTAPKSTVQTGQKGTSNGGIGPLNN